VLSLWRRRAVGSDAQRKLSPPVRANKEQCLSVTNPRESPATDRQGHGAKGKPKLLGLGAPAPASHAPQRCGGHCGAVSPVRRHTLDHTQQHSRGPARESQGSPAHLPVHPAQRSSPPWPAFLPVPHDEAGPEPGAGRKWHAGSVGVLREQRARPCPLPLCLGAAQRGARSCMNAPGIPARNADAEGSGKEGANKRAAAHFRAAEDST